MWMPRAATLCCLAALPLLGCANGVGGQPQAYIPPAPQAYPPQGYIPQAYAPQADVPPGPAAIPAADPGGARVYAVGPGGPAAIMVMLPGAGDVLTADPGLWAAQGFDVVTPPPSELYQFAADREAALERLIASARAMADAPIWLVGPNPAIEAAMAGVPMAGPAQVSGVVVTSIASDTGTCSERMVYSYSGNVAAPEVTVSKSGNACPPGSPFGAAGNPGIAPATPAARPHAPRLIEASAGPAGAPASPRAVVQDVAESIKGQPAS
jgi:hypothetical protein